MRCYWENYKYVIEKFVQLHYKVLELGEEKRQQFALAPPYLPSLLLDDVVEVLASKYKAKWTPANGAFSQIFKVPIVQQMDVEYTMFYKHMQSISGAFKTKEKTGSDMFTSDIWQHVENFGLLPMGKYVNVVRFAAYDTELTLRFEFSAVQTFSHMVYGKEYVFEYYAVEMVFKHAKSVNVEPRFFVTRAKAIEPKLKGVPSLSISLMTLPMVEFKVLNSIDANLLDLLQIGTSCLSSFASKFVEGPIIISKANNMMIRGQQLATVNATVDSKNVITINDIPFTMQSFEYNNNAAHIKVATSLMEATIAVPSKSTNPPYGIYLIILKDCYLLSQPLKQFGLTFDTAFFGVHLFASKITLDVQVVEEKQRRLKIIPSFNNVATTVRVTSSANQNSTFLFGGLVKFTNQVTTFQGKITDGTIFLSGTINGFCDWIEETGKKIGMPQPCYGEFRTVYSCETSSDIAYLCKRSGYALPYHITDLSAEKIHIIGFLVHDSTLMIYAGKYVFSWNAHTGVVELRLERGRSRPNLLCSIMQSKLPQLQMVKHFTDVQMQFQW